MNFGTISTLVLRNLGNRTDLAASLIPELVNVVYQKLVTQSSFPEYGRNKPIPCPPLDTTANLTFATSAFTASLPGDVLFIISTRDITNGAGLHQRDIRIFDRKKSTQNGSPSHYTSYGGAFYIDPPTDKNITITVRYRKTLALPVLVVPTDVPVIGTQWHYALVLGATAEGAASLNFPNAQVWADKFASFIRENAESSTEEEEDFDDGFNLVM